MTPPVDIRIGLPKGSLQESTLALFKKAGFNLTTTSRSYHVTSDDPTFRGLLIRAQEMARYVQQGIFDCGLTGLDWVVEQRADVHEVAGFIYSKASMRPVRWVLAVPNDSPIKSVKDLEGKRIATEVINITTDFLKKHGVNAHVEFSWGATEVKAPELVDAIVDVTETGSSLRANNLRIVEVLLESHTKLIANKEAWANPAKRERIESIAILLQAAIDAEAYVGLKMNLRREDLPRVTQVVPALASPTVSALDREGWIAIESVVEEKTVREILPKLKSLGATGIIEYPLNKLVK